MLKLIEELIGQEAYKKCMDDLYFYDDLDEVGYSKKVKTKDLQALYEEGKLDKEAIMQIVNQELKKGNKISPPAILNLTQKEWDDFLFSNYGEKYKNGFFAIDFNENPLFNTKIENVLKYISPSFDADDIVVIKDEGTNKNQLARINEQKKLLLEVVEQLYVTGMLDKLFDDTSEKIEFVNSLLSKENKFEVVKKDEDKINYDEDVIFVLDGIQDPGNLGTILRTIDSAGLSQLIVSQDTVDAYNPKVVRSTMGAN